MNKTDSVWNNLHDYYKGKDWINNANIFAQQILQYIPKGAKILELGSGQGQDTRFFASNKLDVVSTDISESAIKINNEKLPEDLKSFVTIKKLDMTEKFPFEDESFDVVYAHLSFHYFSIKKTLEILQEVHRVLKNDGLFIMLNNSTTDPEYNGGKEIEKDYFFIEDKNKRFFSTSSLFTITRSHFNTVLLDDLGETYKDAEKGIHNLIRYVGRKITPNQMAVPFTGAIIERKNGNNTELLLQTRWKPDRDPVYSGTFEFPAGVLDKGYENVYETLKREIKEETGLNLKQIINDSQTDIHMTQKDDASFGFRPFCCVQQLKNGKPWIGFIFLCEVEADTPTAQDSEVRDIKWVNKKDVYNMFTNEPDKLFTLEIGAWDYYFKTYGNE